METNGTTVREAIRRFALITAHDFAKEFNGLNSGFDVVHAQDVGSLCEGKHIEGNGAEEAVGRPCFQRFPYEAFAA